MSGRGRHNGPEDGEMETGIKEAQEAIQLYLQPGLGTQKCIEVYDDTCGQYEQHVETYDYTGPRRVAQNLAELYPLQSQRETVQILDVAAGTGLVGVELHKLGFRTMDALDPSQGMLNVAAKRGIYRRLFKEYVNDKQLPIEENSYDSIAIAGGLGENHIPCSGLLELIRLVKPGGYIVNISRAEALTNCSEYEGRLEQLMERLEREGKWRKVTRTPFPNYLKDKEGMLWVHQVL